MLAKIWSISLWSPDSLKIAFEAYISTNPADVAHGYVTSGSGGGVATQVAATTGGTNTLVWSPDSSRLAYTKWTSTPGGFYEFWSVKSDGTGASLLRGDGTYYCDYTALQAFRRRWLGRRMRSTWRWLPPRT